jgi:hypothetical protein
MVRRSSRLTIVVAVAIGCLLAASVGAQPLVSTIGIVSDTCLVPSETGCTRGLLYLVNGNTLQVDATVELWHGLKNIVAGQIVAHPSGTLVYVGQSDRSTPPIRWIDVIDLRTLAKVTTYTVTGNLATISPDGTRLFLVATNSVLVIDSATGAVLQTIPADTPANVATAPDGTRIYVSQGPFNAFSIAVIDAGTGALVQTIPLPRFVGKLKLTPDSSHLYALSSGSLIFDIDPASNTVIGTITDFGGPSSPNDFTFARGRAYVAASLQSGGVSCCEYTAVIDIATRTLVAKIPTVDPIVAEASADGSRVWAITLGDPRLITIDTATNQVIGKVSAPGAFAAVAAVPTQRAASVVIDQPIAATTVQEPFDLSGWAVDVLGLLPGPGIDTVHVWAFPSSGSAPVFVGADYGRPRADVAALFGPSYADSGYHVVVRGLVPGSYQLMAFGHSTRTGAFSIVRTVAVTVASSARLVVDTPSDGAAEAKRFGVAGWAVDGSALADTGIDAVHVWAYPVSGAPPLFAGAATLGGLRPDVAAIFGAQFAAAGYHLEVTTLPPDTYTLVVYGRTSLSGTFAAQQQLRVTVTPPQPMMAVDLPAPNATVGSPFAVAGWAIETGAASGAGVDTVHVWAQPVTGGAPIFLGAATYGSARPDVAALFGPQYLASGFALTTSGLSAGAYYVSVYAHSTATGTFNNVRVVLVTVQ